MAAAMEAVQHGVRLPSPGIVKKNVYQMHSFSNILRRAAQAWKVIRVLTRTRNLKFLLIVPRMPVRDPSPPTFSFPLAIRRPLAPLPSAFADDKPQSHNCPSLSGCCTRPPYLSSPSGQKTRPRCICPGNLSVNTIRYIRNQWS